MINIMLIDPASGHRESGDLALLERWNPASGTLLWLDLDRHDPEQARAVLEQRLSISPLAVTDALRDRHPPKLEWFDEYFFLLVKGFTAETADINFGVVHISIFVGRNFLLTVHALRSPSVEAIWQKLDEGGIDTHRGTVHLCYRLLRRIIDRYAPIIFDLERRLDELEESITESTGDTVLVELVSYNSRLKKLRRNFGYQQACLGELRHATSPLYDEHSAHEFQDAHEHMERLTSLCTLMQELSRDLMDGYISLNGHRLTNIMKTLTIASVIFLPLTFIAGIYGMNFDNMPELHTRTGYFIVVGAMLTIASLQMWYFRRARWI